MSDLLANRYHLHSVLGQGGMGVVHHATDLLNGQDVALKRVLYEPSLLAFNSNQTGSDSRVALAREFRTLASLRHPHIISVLDYGFDANQQPFFTMPLLRNASTIIQAAANKSTEQRIKLLMQLLQALGYLHRRGILHRDLKPSNVLVTADGAVRVLDFGLAARRDEAQGLVGTVAYMAPETLSGGTGTASADLYAVGVIAYEMFTGSLPYNVRDTMQILIAILNSSPDYDLLDVAVQRQRDLDPQIPHDITTKVLPNAVSMTMSSDTGKSRVARSDGERKPLTAVIQQLLQKDPAARFPDAATTLQHLNALLEKPVALETDAIRESYLQAAAFVGRADEYERLRVAVLHLIDGQGGGWLVGGESGVGKSRLVAELRAVAMVEGALVLSGQGVADGGLVYQFWRDALRMLLLHVQVTVAEASILQQIVPDVATLLQLDLDTPPHPTSAESLHDVIAAVFKRVAVPVVLVLEDLQWATESLDVLKRLHDNLRAMQVLVIGTFRTEESPHLPAALPDFEVLRLERLPRHEIAALSRSILGEAGAAPRIVQFLHQQTEGNCFFVVEVLRALASEAGRLENVARMAVPADFAAGGVQRILERRLQQVPAWARPLLDVAALAGRNLDLAVLAAVNRALHLTPSLEPWLNACAEAAVLEVHDGVWRFGHDRMRDSVLATIQTRRQRDLHADLADAIAHIYAADLDAHAVILFNHWVQANDAPKARQYAARAAQVAVQAQRYNDALRFVDALLELRPNDVERAAAHRMRGLIYFHQGANAAAETELQAAIQKALDIGSRRIQANALQTYAELLVAEGRHAEATTRATAALSMFEALESHESVATTHVIMAMMYRTTGDLTQALHHLDIALQLGQQHQLPQIVGKVSNLRAVIHYFRNQLNTAMQDALASLAIARQTGARRMEFDALINLGGFEYIRGNLKAAADHYRAALQLAEESGYARGSVAVQNLASIASDEGDMATATAYYERALVALRRSNNHEALATCLVNMSEMLNDHGQHQRAAELALEASTVANNIDSPYAICAANVNLGLARLRQNQYAEAVAPLEAAAAVDAEDMDYEAWLALALAYLATQQPDLAHHQAARAIERAKALVLAENDLYPGWFALGLGRLLLSTLDNTPADALADYRAGLAHANHAGIRLHQRGLVALLEDLSGQHFQEIKKLLA